MHTCHNINPLFRSPPKLPLSFSRVSSTTPKASGDLSSAMTSLRRNQPMMSRRWNQPAFLVVESSFLSLSSTPPSLSRSPQRRRLRVSLALLDGSPRRLTSTKSNPKVRLCICPLKSESFFVILIRLLCCMRILSLFISLSWIQQKKSLVFVYVCVLIQQMMASCVRCLIC